MRLARRLPSAAGAVCTSTPSVRMVDNLEFMGSAAQSPPLAGGNDAVR
ncbi:MAG: hypothetical protein RLZ98_1237 [Pseudomonadota bacterium]|jgi:hypothetical protein